MQQDSVFIHVLELINSQDYNPFFVLKGTEPKNRSLTRKSFWPVEDEGWRTGGFYTKLVLATY